MLTLNRYLKERFGERVQKIPIDAGLACPNRDGTKGRKGCIYCDPRGSGTGAAAKGVSVAKQMRLGMEWAKRRYGARKFIAYFQSYSNTYAPLERLEELYTQALQGPQVVGVSIGTRPDCIDHERLDLISQVFKGKMVWVELGLQSASDETLKLINRGHTFKDFEKAVHLVKEFGFLSCVHVIFGLPGETREHMERTIKAINRMPLDGIKFHQLYVLKGTPLHRLYEKGGVDPLSQEEYAKTVAWSIKQLKPGMVVQRLVGDPPGQGLVAPLWSRNKQETINLVNKFLSGSQVIEK